MKIVVLAGVLVALTAGLAGAAPWDGRRGGAEPPRGPQHDQAAPWRGGPPRERDGRAERDDRRQGSLSEEDRRSLHRDLDRANRELYRRH